MLLHLSLAMARSNALLPASPNWRPGSAASNNPEEGNSLAREAAFLHGVKAWRAHPWRRDLPDPPVVWREASARLLDHGGAGTPMLFVPSLVNRWTVLDLMADHSMLRWLAANGIRPLLLDWGDPEPAFTPDDHIAGRLLRAIEAAGVLGDKPILAGYCMGGTFAVAAAVLRPDLIRGLVLLAAPWDFHAGGAETHHLAATLRPLLAPWTTIPVDLLQTLFALNGPDAVAAKFRRFGRLDPASPEAILFVALEDWLNDGVALSGTTARACLRDWYGENQPMRGTWRIADRVIDPASLRLPAFVAVPRRDRIVPPAMAMPLATLIPGATRLEPDTGHIGMTAGRRAPDLLWAPLRDWVRAVAPA